MNVPILSPSASRSSGVLGRDEFDRLAEPALPALRLHCYRLMGSLDDAEDMVQDALVRAWCHRERLVDNAGFRPWLYRIATNACLDLLDRQRRRPATSLPDDPGWPDPAPDSWLGLERTGGDPADHAVQREAVGLAFLTAVRILSPRQRAVLVLRDVLGWNVADIAEALDTSATAVYSAVRRARLATQENAMRALPGSAQGVEANAAEVARRYLAAWEQGDAAGLAELLAADARMAMPPDPRAYLGRAAILEYFAAILVRPDQDRIQLAPTSANGMPAFVVLKPDPEGRLSRIGVMALLFRGLEIVEIRGYMSADLALRFE
jgi:RNA polymerase sigma-70 factor, ECF subfamily